MSPRIAPVLVVMLILAGCASKSRSDAPERGEPSVAYERSYASGVASPANSEASSQPREIETVRMHVAGMTCPTKCVREVKAMLADVPGIVSVAVDSPSQTVTCEVTRGTDPMTIVTAIKYPYRATIQ